MKTKTDLESENKRLRSALEWVGNRAQFGTMDAQDREKIVKWCGNALNGKPQYFGCLLGQKASGGSEEQIYMRAIKAQAARRIRARKQRESKEDQRVARVVQPVPDASKRALMILRRNAIRDGDWVRIRAMYWREANQ